MTLTEQQTKGLIAGVLLMIVGSLGGGIWQYRDLIRHYLYKPFTVTAPKPVPAPPPTQITVKQTLTDNPVPTQKPTHTTTVRVREVEAKKPVISKNRIHSFCKFDAYKDTARCKK